MAEKQSGLPEKAVLP
ncbi:hypothetical protein TNCT_598201, partial [Trichonephila clavata]